MKAADGGGALTRENRVRWRQQHPSPMILSLGHDTPSRLPSSQANPPFSLVCRAATLQGEEGHLGALIGDQREAVGIVPNHPGMLAESAHFFSTSHTQSRGKGSHTLSLGFPAWGACDFYNPIWQNLQIPSLQNCQLSTPMVQSAIQWDAGMGAFNLFSHVQNEYIDPTPQDSERIQ